MGSGPPTWPLLPKSRRLTQEDCISLPHRHNSRSLEDTPLVWVDTEEGLQAMVEALAGAKHVAIDLENHSFR